MAALYAPPPPRPIWRVKSSAIFVMGVLCNRHFATFPIHYHLKDDLLNLFVKTDVHVFRHPPKGDLNIAI